MTDTDMLKLLEMLKAVMISERAFAVVEHQVAERELEYAENRINWMLTILKRMENPDDAMVDAMAAACAKVAPNMIWNRAGVKAALRAAVKQAEAHHLIGVEQGKE